MNKSIEGRSPLGYNKAEFIEKDELEVRKAFLRQNTSGLSEEEIARQALESFPPEVVNERMRGALAKHQLGILRLHRPLNPKVGLNLHSQIDYIQQDSLRWGKRDVFAGTRQDKEESQSPINRRGGPPFVDDMVAKRQLKVISDQLGKTVGRSIVDHLRQRAERTNEQIQQSSSSRFSLPPFLLGRNKDK